VWGWEPPAVPELSRFAVLQLSGCAGCEVALLNAEAWLDEYRLLYMPLVISAYDVPKVDVLLVSGGLRTDEDLHNLRVASSRAERVIAIGTCAISGGVASLGDRDDVRELFLEQQGRPHIPRLLPRCHPIDTAVAVDLYVPGCPPTPELFLAALLDPAGFKASRIVCRECGRRKQTDMRPSHLIGFQQGVAQSGICLINQGYLCIGSSTRGGCRAPCPRAGHPCVGCRGPADIFLDKRWQEWLATIQRVFTAMTDIPEGELGAALRSPQLSLFLFQFADFGGRAAQVRPKEKVL
jgi:F420-non-reducing hydrogenase small subunit